jgi:hypothetical protein
MQIIRKTWYNNGGTFLSGPFLSEVQSFPLRGSNEVDLMCPPLGARNETMESLGASCNL